MEEEKEMDETEMEEKEEGGGGCGGGSRGDGGCGEGSGGGGGWDGRRLANADDDLVALIVSRGNRIQIAHTAAAAPYDYLGRHPSNNWKTRAYVQRKARVERRVLTAGLRGDELGGKVNSISSFLPSTTCKERKGCTCSTSHGYRDTHASSAVHKGCTRT